MKHIFMCYLNELTNKAKMKVLDLKFIYFNVLAIKVTIMKKISKENYRINNLSLTK